MDIKIIKQEKKPLLSREEFTAIVNEKTTPSNNQLKEEISKKFDKSIDLIIIKKIIQKFGKDEIEAKFYVYNNMESLKKFENQKIKKASAS